MVCVCLAFGPREHLRSQITMAQRGSPQWREIDPPFWARQPAPRTKRFYDLEVLPKQAQVAGLAWASDFARLPDDEQRAIVVRLTVTRIRACARRAGHPEPIITEVTLRPDGTVVEGSERPLREEWGGRTPETPEPPKTDISSARKAARR
jgi:hypothetical protein